MFVVSETLNRNNSREWAQILNWEISKDIKAMTVGTEHIHYADDVGIYCLCEEWADTEVSAPRPSEDNDPRWRWREICILSALSQKQADL